MATILWPTSPAGPDDSTTGGLPAPDPVESKVRHMDSLRRFVGDLLAGEMARLRPGRTPPPPPWAMEARLADDLGADSLERLQLATALG